MLSLGSREISGSVPQAGAGVCSSASRTRGMNCWRWYLAGSAGWGDDALQGAAPRDAAVRALLPPGRSSLVL